MRQDILSRTNTFRDNPFTRKIYSKRQKRQYHTAAKWRKNYDNYWKKYNKISQQALGQTEKPRERRDTVGAAKSR